MFSDGIVRFLTGERGHKRLVQEEFPDGRAKHYNDDEPEGVWHCDGSRVLGFVVSARS